MPITINHPYDDDGDPASGRSPDISEKVEIGRVYSANNNGGKLRSEAWINMTLARQKLPKYDGGAEVLNKLERGEPVELSTGLFTENFPASKHATYNGKPYDFVARNYRPDHLAILLKEKGACSLDDGCGINVYNAEELEGGRWVTTGSGNRLYIKDGAPVAGNPHVLKSAASKELTKVDYAKKTDEVLKSLKGEKQASKDRVKDLKQKIRDSKVREKKANDEYEAGRGDTPAPSKNDAAAIKSMDKLLAKVGDKAQKTDGPAPKAKDSKEQKDFAKSIDKANADAKSEGFKSLADKASGGAPRKAKVTGVKSGPKGVSGWLKSLKSLFSGNAERKRFESRVDSLLRRL